MRDLSRLFDRSGGVQRPPLRRFVGEYWALIADNPAPPAPADLPNGNGRVVLVVPGFLCSDQTTTAPLRRFLDSCGFRCVGWDYGVNWGPTEGALAHLRRRVIALADLNGGPIDLVGVSLGGLLARNVAYDEPARVRHVITLASPFRLPTASGFEPLIRLCGLFYSQNLQLARFAAPLPVPSTAFYTQDDGVVAWESCRSEEPGCANIGVTGPHMTICPNPAVLSRLVPILAGEDRGFIRPA
jgi:pimeloyl-ACP methyl ester carboxylesterase